MKSPEENVIKELQEYRKLGSIEELKNLKEKNTAKRTDKKEVHHKKAKKERAGERERQFY